MKRIAMALAAAMLLGLCACGQGAAPILEPVILRVVEQTWTGWSYKQPKPIKYDAEGLDIGT